MELHNIVVIEYFAVVADIMCKDKHSPNLDTSATSPSSSSFAALNRHTLLFFAERGAAATTGVLP
jgi:hypothetical protein